MWLQKMENLSHLYSFSGKMKIIYKKKKMWMNEKQFPETSYHTRLTKHEENWILYGVVYIFKKEKLFSYQTFFIFHFSYIHYTLYSNVVRGRVFGTQPEIHGHWATWVKIMAHYSVLRRLLDLLNFLNNNPSLKPLPSKISVHTYIYKKKNNILISDFFY